MHAAITNLENARLRLDMLSARVETLRQQAIPPEVRAALAEIDEEFAPAIAAAEAAYKAAEEEAKALVVEHGATIKGQILQVVYTKGRITWDAKALDGYAINRPELFAFRSESSPSASVRFLK